MNRRTLVKGAAIAATAGLLGACAQMPMMGGGGSGGGADIVDVAAKNPDFSTLVTAVQTAGLTETLKGDGPFTVFAPTNAAFEKLPDGTVDSLLQPENRDKLTEILTYHVVPGEVTADRLAGERLGVKTVQGGTVHVDGTDDHSPTGVRVDDANVTTVDIEASNGVIHVIDSVIMPD
jgi:uncharacterized surface protein with fasciclin (FAS1) repeats